MKRVNFLWLLLSVVCCLGFISCKGLNEPDNPNVNKDFVYSKTGMYVGITGFSDAINFYGSDEYRYKILSNSKPYESFINGLSMGGATVLYYAVDNNLSYLEKCAFPDDVSSVSIITFTDGLDQGSRAYDQDNNYTANSKSYVEAIAEKLQRIKVNNLPINAYAIGVRGSDVKGDAVATFENNLLKLSSSKENAMQVSNMDEVNAKFEAIAKSLYSKTETHSLTITIPMPSENEKERFTFDDVTDPTKSKCYLEGVYANGALNDIKYVGCQSSSGAKVLETFAGGVKIQFLFENFTDLKGNAISTTKMQQWHMEEGATTWTRNSEFKPTESINVEEKRTSAVVMLILDCSSSLGASDFAKVKSAAINFVKTLAGEVTSKEPDTPDNPDTPETPDTPDTPDNPNPNTGLTYNVTVPNGTYTCYIAGTMTTWTLQEMTKVDDTHYTITFADATTDMEYMYCSGPDWDYIERTITGEEVAARTYSTSDVVEAWRAVYNPDNIPNQGEAKDIIIKAKVPAEWTDEITAWVWPTGGEGHIVVPTKEGDWYVYSQYSVELNIIFRNGADWNGNENQTVDMFFTESACIEITAGSDKATYTHIDCEGGNGNQQEPDIPKGAVVFDADVDNEGVGTESNNATAYSVTKDGVTMTVSSGILGTYNNENHYRVYKNQTLTLFATAGNIVKVEFTCTANDETKYGPGCFTASTGDYTWSGPVGTWTGSASEVVFTAATNQVRVTQMVVIIEGDTPNEPSGGVENGHIWVDLGLSVKWATCNVGANTPEGYGDYFAWGETTTKSTYNWSTYKYCNGSDDSFTKYNNSSSSLGTVDNKTTLELSDDAARANWGGSWRMPAFAEWTELREKCTWTWTTQNGVNGYRVTSKSNGNSIFLPAAGYRDDSSLYNAGSYGLYWSSLLGWDSPLRAYGLFFGSSNVSRDYDYRYFGFSVRPVCP